MGRKLSGDGCAAARARAAALFLLMLECIVIVSYVAQIAARAAASQGGMLRMMGLVWLPVDEMIVLVVLLVASGMEL